VLFRSPPADAATQSIWSNPLTFAVLYGAATLLHALIGSYYNVRLLSVRDRILAVADRLLMRKVAGSIGIASFEEPEARDRIRLASAGGQALPALLSASVEAAQHVVTVLSVSLTVGWYHPLIVPLVILPAIPLFYSQVRVSADTFAALANKSPIYRRMAYFIDLMLGTAAAKEIRIFRSGGFFLRKYGRAADNIFATSQARRRQATSSLISWGLVNALGVGGAFIYVVSIARRGSVTVGDVVMFISAVAFAGGAIRGLIQSASTLMTQTLEVGAFLDFINAPEPEQAPTIRRAVTSTSTREPEWRLRDVSYRYPGRREPAVDRVSFDIHAGEKLAIVGFNGAGKSTILKLMLRLLEPDDGEILFRGTPLREWHVDDVRRECGVVFQDYVKFRLTLYENIALALPERPAGVFDAASRAGVDEIARAAADGFHTQLGSEFAGGIDLSEGQWQRVAMARGFARNPSALLLDEPTASLDAKAEQALLTQLLSFLAERTTIIVSHRLAVTPMVDRVIVLEHGRIVEQGSHARLMTLDGMYADMYRTQARMYWPDAAPEPAKDAASHHGRAMR